MNKEERKDVGRIDCGFDILERREGESEFDHHRRLIYGKLEDKTLADYDYSELSPYLYGKLYSADNTRRMMSGSYKTLQLAEQSKLKNITSVDILEEIDAKKRELQKERYRFFDQRNAYNKELRERSRQEELNDIIKDVVQAGNYPSLEYTYHPISSSDNDLLVSLTDIHYGADIDNYWCTYNSTVCRNMFRLYLDEILTIAKRHNSENCIIWANGDLIHGNIHYSVAVTNRENVIQQIVGVTELIAEFIAELSAHFRTVRFVSVGGNHSRLNPDKDKALKDERMDDLVEWYLRARLQNFENVVIGDCDKIDSTMYLVDVRGNTFVGVHGDYDTSRSQAQDLTVMAGKKVYGILTGHKHHNKFDTVQGVRILMGGSFIGMDDYCVSKRIYGDPEQLVAVCSANGVECMYPVSLKLEG